MSIRSGLASRLSAARHGRFVGRESERILFQSLLSTPEPLVHLLYVFGPGGVGKSTLLREFALVCEQAAVPAIYLDARNIDPSPESLNNALCQAVGAEPPASPLEVIAGHPGPYVLLIDTYEILAPLDEWIREVFLTQLPENTLVVLAGRHAPSPAWRADPGWQTLIRTIPLRNLSPQEARDYLVKRAVPDNQLRVVQDFTHGHPLALSLVADLFAQREGIQFRPEDAPDVVKMLLEQFVQGVPGPAHRAALEVCALVCLTTEALLAEMLNLADAHELFEWLRGLSFVESGQGGLFPHDLAREALAADLRWRNPDWNAELHRRARDYYTARVRKSQGREQQRHLFDLIYLHRNNPVVRPFFEWQESGGLLTEIAQPADFPLLIEMVARHEGDESARLAAHWFARQPQHVLVFREPTKAPAGFMAVLDLTETTEQDRALDPAIRAAWSYLQKNAPLRPGEKATHFRFWMAQDTYQAVSAAQSMSAVHAARHYLTTPGLVYTFLPCADPDFWTPVLGYSEMVHIPEADFTVNGRCYGVFGHNWRAIPPMTWLLHLAEKEIATAPEIASPPPIEPVIVLSETEFADAVRDALRDITQPTALRGNALLRSRLVMGRAGPQAGPAERVAALQTLIQETAAALQQSPREAKLYRALYHTYFQPAPTQEQAAEILDLPFSTFRRHLRAGIAQITTALWQKEIGAL